MYHCHKIYGDAIDFEVEELVKNTKNKILTPIFTSNIKQI